MPPTWPRTRGRCSYAAISAQPPNHTTWAQTPGSPGPSGSLSLYNVEAPPRHREKLEHVEALASTSTPLPLSVPGSNPRPEPFASEGCRTVVDRLAMECSDGGPPRGRAQALKWRCAGGGGPRGAAQPDGRGARARGPAAGESDDGVFSTTTQPPQSLHTASMQPTKDQVRFERTWPGCRRCSRESTSRPPPAGASSLPRTSTTSLTPTIQLQPLYSLLKMR